MTSYSDMTDKEINNLVIEALGMVAGRNISVDGSPNVATITTKTQLGSRFEAIDYCNDWSAIGPIIEECQITICPKRNIWWAQAGPGENLYFTDGNPKRAAAICFLMMKGSEK